MSCSSPSATFAVSGKPHLDASSWDEVPLTKRAATVAPAILQKCRRLNVSVFDIRDCLPTPRGRWLMTGARYVNFVQTQLTELCLPNVRDPRLRATSGTGPSRASVPG